MKIMLKRVKITVKGRVQGVGFRYFVLEKASNLQLKGTTRNMPDGSVETIAEGEDKSIESLCELLKRGPASAEVTNITIDYFSPTGEFSTFRIIR